MFPWHCSKVIIPICGSSHSHTTTCCRGLVSVVLLLPVSLKDSESEDQRLQDISLDCVIHSQVELLNTGSI